MWLLSWVLCIFLVWLGFFAVLTLIFVAVLLALKVVDKINDAI